MKICAIICEYNPFHNGHLYQIEKAKELSDADSILCIMSGNFVQRGESAVMDKCTRAKHAILAGADCVIELPSPFASSNAELFAKGAISILNKIPAVTSLCFGAESPNAKDFIKTATLLNDEPKEVSKKIKTLVKEGVSYAKARATAFEAYLPSPLLSSPNNILGVEYTRAILDTNANIEILPILRQGGGYTDENLYEDFSSASAIRKNLELKNELGDTLPAFVKADLPTQIETHLDKLEKYAILIKNAQEIASVCDCTEGLENAFKKAATKEKTLVESLTSARYTSSRIRRIALQNLLGISHEFIKACLSAPLYLRVLAVKKGNTEILTALSESALPLLIRAHEEEKLQGVARECYQKDIFAEDVYTLLYGEKKQKNILI